MTIEHSEECKQAQAVAAAFLAAHPNRCEPCGGLGWIDLGYDSDTGSRDFDPCEKCVEQGRCPICAAEALDEGGERCSACGWDVRKPPRGAGVHECCCWEEASLDGLTELHELIAQAEEEVAASEAGVITWVDREWTIES